MNRRFYDANGNTTQDGARSYAWDADGHAVTVGSVSAVYDALGRMVESGTTQIVYAPTGQKFALMSGQTVSKAFVPLPGGAQAVYAGTTLTYYRHPDWLGSSRLATTPGRTVYSSLAYAPFGETYAESGTPDRSFTGQNQDTIQGGTAGLYDFLYREYALYGRWISPDPAGFSAATLSSPQSLNRYAYVVNAPTIYLDPYGLFLFADPDYGAGGPRCKHGYEPGGPNGDCRPSVEGNSGIPLAFMGYIVCMHSYCGPPGTPPGGGGGGNSGLPCLAGAGPLAPGQSRCPADNGQIQAKTIPYDKACPGGSAVVNFSLSGNLFAGANFSITLGLNSTGVTVSTTLLDGAVGLPQAAASAGAGYQDIGATTKTVDVNFFKNVDGATIQSKAGVTVPLNSANTPVGFIVTAGKGGSVFKPPVAGQVNGSTNTQSYCWAF